MQRVGVRPIPSVLPWTASSNRIMLHVSCSGPALFPSKQSTTRQFRKLRPACVAAWLLTPIAPGCGDSAENETPGTLRVLLEPEDTITSGLRPGSEVEAIADGWTITYDKYLLAVGRIAVDYATDRSLGADDRDVFVADLTQLPSSGETLWKVEGLQPGRWNFGFEFATASSKSKRHDSVDEADFERMVDGGYTYLISGTLTKEEGQSCPPTNHSNVTDIESTAENSAGDACYPNSTISFEFAVAANAKFRNCELDGVAGFALAEAATATEAITVHGDHLFFNGFPAGSEGGVMRLAQLWADTDLNVDGKIDVAEFGDVLIADMPEWDDRYQLGGAPEVGRLETLGDVVAAQLMTQGHMNGEGECEAIPAQ
jgi:hypothetical protein